MTSTAPDEDRLRAVYAKRQGAARYAWSNPGHLYMMQELERRMLSRLARRGVLPLTNARVLEIGCGTAHWLREFVKWGARPHNVAGIDLLPDRIADARALCAPGTTLECGSATALPFPDASFDLVFQSTVFTSILDTAVRHQVAAEMLRVVRPTGILLWYDFLVDNPRNADVRGVRRAELRQLFPGCRLSLERITLAPPLARRLAPRSWILCHLLGRIPLLCTHYLGMIEKR